MIALTTVKSEWCNTDCNELNKLEMCRYGWSAPKQTQSLRPYGLLKALWHLCLKAWLLILSCCQAVTYIRSPAASVTSGCSAVSLWQCSWLAWLFTAPSSVQGRTCAFLPDEEC